MAAWHPADVSTRKMIYFRVNFTDTGKYDEKLELKLLIS